MVWFWVLWLLLDHQHYIFARTSLYLVVALMSWRSCSFGSAGLALHLLPQRIDGVDSGVAQPWIWAWMVAELVSLSALQGPHNWCQFCPNSLCPGDRGVGLALLHPHHSWCHHHAGTAEEVNSVQTHLSSWPPAAARTIDIQMAIGGNMGHGH